LYVAFFLSNVMTSASARAQQAAEANRDDETIPCGIVRAQENGNSVYSVLPTPFSDNMDIEQGTPLHVSFDVSTGSFVVSPIDI